MGKQEINMVIARSICAIFCVLVVSSYALSSNEGAKTLEALDPVEVPLAGPGAGSPPPSLHILQRLLPSFSSFLALPYDRYPARQFAPLQRDCSSKSPLWCPLMHPT